jgi:hypothetical protein
MGSARGLRGKATTAQSSAKAVARAPNKAQPRKATKAAKRWNLIPSSEATFERLSEESNTMVLLSKEEAEWRRSVERAAKEDPEAYLEACRSGRL